MSEDFKILEERTIGFKNNKLYVMLLRELGEFGVEVASKTEGFGRKFAEDRTKATELFEAVADKLSTIKNFDKAEATIKDCFSLKDLNEIFFLLKSEDVVRSQASIGDLYDIFKFIVKPKFNYKGDKKSKGSLTIYISFGKKKKPIGRFIGTEYGDDFVFERL